MVFAVLVAGALALAPAADAYKLKIPKIPKGAPKNGGFKIKKPVVIKSEVTCKASAEAINFKYSKDAHTNAIAAAFVYACTHKPDPLWGYNIFTKAKAKAGQADYAVAFARAISAVETSCYSNGKGYGCAVAFSHAQAWAKAVATAHAEAWAEAVGECECDYKEQTAIAAADGNSYDSAWLVASVESYAQAEVCIGPGEYFKYEHEQQTCIQDIYAYVISKAVAEAVVEGYCFPSKWYKSEKEYGKLTADAEIYVKTEIDITEIAGCVDYVDYYNPYYH